MFGVVTPHMVWSTFRSGNGVKGFAHDIMSIAVVSSLPLLGLPQGGWMSPYVYGGWLGSRSTGLVSQEGFPYLLWVVYLWLPLSGVQVIRSFG